MKTKREIYNVLVVDDDEFLLDSIKKKLEDSGYRVTVSNNIHDAIFKMGLIEPDLILLDIIMPDLNGIELMALIRKHFAMNTAPIILMSSLTKKEVADMGYRIGETHYLVKPFNVNSLPVLLNQISLR